MFGKKSFFNRTFLKKVQIYLAIMVFYFSLFTWPPPPFVALYFTVALCFRKKTPGNKKATWQKG